VLQTAAFADLISAWQTGCAMWVLNNMVRTRRARSTTTPLPVNPGFVPSKRLVYSEQKSTKRILFVDFTAIKK
jgi:hypothetical protein